MTRQDARDVARTTALLAARSVDGRDPVEDALTLHRIAGSLHRYDERACNEDLGCRRCQGEGRILHREPERGESLSNGSCRACAGFGTTVGRRVANLEAKARAIAAAYGFRAYFPGDCRGCPLYLIPAKYPAAEDDSHYSSRGTAVVWLG